MKRLRICLLVLLAVLVPVRGAVAAAMLCPPPAGHAHGGEAHGHHHQHDTARQHGHDTTGHDQCNLCSAICSLTPMPSDVAGIDEPRGLVDAPFPDIAAAVPSFLCEGPERPPRTI